MMVFNCNLLLRTLILRRSVACFSSVTTSNLFRGSRDVYGGVVVRSCDEPAMPLQVVGLRLKESLEKWISDGVFGVWFEVEPASVDWIPLLVKEGFTFHHAGPKSAVLFKWLPVDVPCGVPNHAHTSIGVGALVMNQHSEVLAVQEKQHDYPHWKLPGGFVEPGESLPDAVVREVFEETGVQTEFSSLLAVRHAQYSPGSLHIARASSDLYFTAHAVPVADTEIKTCSRELRAACWMKISHFAVHPLVHRTNRDLVSNFIASMHRSTPAVTCKKPPQSPKGSHQQIYFLGGLSH